eukprot:g16038.t1
MVAKGSRRRDNKKSNKEEYGAGQSDSSEEDDSDVELEEGGPPLKFVLAGDDTGSGIDYNVLDEDSWQKLEEYCKKWGLKQAHLESIYSRFARTIARTEHLDFTLKPQFHASLDFLADEFMTTAGEFAAQFFIQTWFLRRKRGLRPPKDRRCVDFARLVIMCCDLARLGDYELLANLWASVLHRFGGILPNGSINLDTRLNTELVNEVITVLHTTDKKLELLVDMLLAESEELDDLTEGGTSAEREVTKEGEGVGQNDGSVEESGGKAKRYRCRYLTLRSILRFSFQHPPLLFPVVQFQRVLRSKIIGSRYWLRRRKPAPERGLIIRDLLGLPNAYHDVFDRIESRRDAWTVASGHILLHAVDPPPHTTATPAAPSSSSSPKLGDNRSGGDQSGGRGGGESTGVDGEAERTRRYDERCRQLLDNCVPPPWYEAADEAASPTAVIGAVGEKIIPALTVALTRFKANARTPTSPKSAPTSPRLGGTTTTPSATKSGEERHAFVAAEGAPAPGGRASLSDRSRSRRSRSKSVRSRSRSRSQTPSNNTVPASTAAPTPATKTCAICLRKSSPVALCRRCGRRAVKAFKDNHGSRRARVVLVPYGAFFGVGEPSALQREGDSVKRWVRLLDDETGAEFYYNAHYDSAVWKSGIDMPKPEPVAKIPRRRKVGGGDGHIMVASPPNSGSYASLPSSPVAPLPTKNTDEGAASAPRLTGTAAAAAAAGAIASAGSIGRTALRNTQRIFSAASMAALHAATRGGTEGNAPGGSGGAGNGPRATIKPALKLPSSPTPSSAQKTAATAAAASPPAAGVSVGHRVVLLMEGDGEVVLDAHKRIYPPFRLISWEDGEKAAAAAAAAVTQVAMEGVTPGPGLGFGRKNYARGGSATPVDSGGGRPSLASKGSPMKRAGTMARAGTMSAAETTVAAAT